MRERWGSSRVARKTIQVRIDAAMAALRVPIFASSRSAPVEGQGGDQQRDREADAGDRPRPGHGGPAHRRADAPAGHARHQPGGADDPDRLPQDVAAAGCPSVIGEVKARDSRSRRRSGRRRWRARRAARSHSSSTAWKACCSRSFAGDRRGEPQARLAAKLGRGLLAEERKRSLARSRSLAGRRVGVGQQAHAPGRRRPAPRRPCRGPAQPATPSSAYTRPRLKPTACRPARAAGSPPVHAEGHQERRHGDVLAVGDAMTTRATRSSTTATVRRNARRRIGKPGPTSASIPSANAVSVDIAAPQPCATSWPALTAR